MQPTNYSRYFENAAVSVLVYAGGIAVFRYKPGKRSTPDLQAAFTQLSNLLRQRNWHTVLTDQREMLPFSDSEADWITEFWTSYFAQYGGQIQGAVVASPDVFARLAASRLWHNNQRLALKITYKIFEAEEQALAWLLMQVS